MRHQQRGARPAATLRIEQCEPRVVMSADPISTLYAAVIESTIASAAATPTVPSASPLANFSFDTIRGTYGFTGQGQTVVVIDSGIDYNHEAFGGGFGAGHRVVGGWDFAESDGNPTDDGPAGGHGTHVAGILGSSDPAHLGAAPGVDLVSLRVFDDRGNGDFTLIDAALRWVHQNRNTFANPITTVNLSIGSSWNSESVPAWATLESDFAQLKADGIFISVAAGNSFTTYNAPGLSYPAASPYVVPVASVDANGALSYFSQRDDRVLAAPGRNIVSSVPDYLGNRNGVEDDFAAFSGTSMAAPYVAGASVLLRQAYAFAGVTNVTEDTLYNVLRNTADTVFDPATNHSYKVIDINRAIDSIMPASDPWSSAAAANNLGTVVDTASASGAISRLAAHDYFRFTAGQTGIATFTLDTSDGLKPQWQLVGGSGSVDPTGKTFSFSVVAGQTYTFDLGTAGAIGHYHLAGTIQGQYTDWGSVALAQIHDRAIDANNNGFTLHATRDGVLTVQAFFTQAAGNIRFDLYDTTGRLLGSSASQEYGMRLDVNVVAGQTLIMRTHGANAHVDFRLSNLLNVSGSTVTVYGAEGDNQFEFDAGNTHHLAIDGVDWWFDGRVVKTVHYVGGSGQDTVTLNAAGANNVATFRPGSVALAGANYSVQADQAEAVVVNATGSGNRALFYDSAGDDNLLARPTSVRFVGPGFDHTASGFAQVQAFAGHGTDHAFLFDSAGNDTLTARPTDVQLTGAGFNNRVSGFGTVYAIASRGVDQATFYGTSGNDSFYANSRVALLRGQGFANSESGFSRVRVVGAGGRDQAVLYGSGGSDTLIAKPDSVELKGTGFDNVVQGFAQVQANAAGGASDAYFYDSAGDDAWVASPNRVELSGIGFDNVASGFRSVRAFSSGGHDVASLYDSWGDDTLIARSGYARLYGAGFDNAAYGFAQVRATSLFGHDTAQVSTSSVDNLFAADGKTAHLASAVSDELIRGFAQVAATATDGGPARVEVDAVDFWFRQLGNWSSTTAAKSPSPTQ